jgi:hypothetical protein
MSRIARLRSALLLVTLAAAPAVATTIVPVSDEALVDKAELVIEGTVDDSINVASKRPATDWLVTVDRVLKGRYDSSSLVVRTPGGIGADGLELRIHGAPALAPGRRVVLFLGPERDGARRIVDFPQGAFLAGDSRSRSLAFRDLSQVLDASSGRSGVRDPLRDVDRFADWIEARADGLHRFKTYVVTPRQSELKVLAQDFQLRLYNGGHAERWFSFDTGGEVMWYSHESGLPGLAGGGAGEVQRATAAWTNEPSTPVRLSYGGTAPEAAGLDEHDGRNVVLWNDPNDEMEGRFSCFSQGTLAIGGTWVNNSRRPFDGKSYAPIVGGDVVFNDGVDCFRKYASNYSKFIEGIVLHELGHTLGIGHSSENSSERRADLRSARMYFQISRYDTRGARLEADDIAALQALYLAGSGRGWSSSPGDSCQRDRLCLLGGRFVVMAHWSNQFDDSSGWASAIPSTDLAGFLYFTDPSNIELAVKVVDFGSEVKVFYSQLTNLKFTLYVTDTTTGRVKSYTNTPGDCGAIDNDFMAGAASATVGPMAIAAPATVGGSCGPAASTLCLLDGRFAVTVDWRNQFTGAAGSGMPRKLSNLSGAFAFDNASNLELLIKTLDFGDHVLVLYGALSNLEYSIRVTETASGRTKTYSNPAGKFCGGIDNNF